MQNLAITLMTTFAKLISGVTRALGDTKTLSITIGFIGLIGISSLAMGREVHEAHTHGVANLTLVFENGALEIQFESPAMSLLGFEHKPKTKEQMETIERTKAILSSPTKVIFIEGANCAPVNTDVEIHGPAGQAIENTREQEHDHHDSDGKHTEHSTSHSEILATYRFDCVDGEKIRSTDVALFEYFPSLESINVHWVTEAQQGQSTLQPKAATIEFR